MDISRTLEAAASPAKNRLELWSNVISELQMTVAIEVGVCRGDFARHILQGCPKIRQYFMIDPWRQLDGWNKPANKSDIEFAQIKKEAMQKTAFAEDRRIVLEGKTSEVSGEIAQNSVDFAYIDGDHTLRGISIDLSRILPKLRDGGIIAGDDFCPSIWQHPSAFEPTFVFPFAVHFAEAMECAIYGLPFNQFAIVVDKSPGRAFEFVDLTGKYKTTALRENIQKRDAQYTKFAALYGDFHFEEDYRNLQVSGLEKESGRIRGEIVKAITDISSQQIRVLLPGENNRVKQTYCDLLGIANDQIVTAGLADAVDYGWNFEHDPPDFGKFDLIISQAMMEHLIDPFKHLKDLADALELEGHLIVHTVIPGFDYHRYPIDCLRFFPDWFEETAKRTNLIVCDKYIGELRIMYTFQKPR